MSDLRCSVSAAIECSRSINVFSDFHGKNDKEPVAPLRGEDEEGFSSLE